MNCSGQPLSSRRRTRIISDQGAVGPGSCVMATVAEALAAAMKLHQSGDFARAEGIYQEILRVDPSNADALHYLGLIAYQVGKPGPALDYINQSLKFKPD